MNILTVAMKKNVGWPHLEVLSPHRTQSEPFDIEHWETVIIKKIYFAYGSALFNAEGFSHCKVSFPHHVDRKE